MTQSMQEQEYQSDTIHFRVLKKPFCQIEIEASLSQEEVTKAKEQAIKAILKQVSIPGFRKGHAPVAAIEKRYPKEIQKEQVSVLLRKALHECKTTVPVTPLEDDQVRVGMRKLSGESATVGILFETAPEVPDIDPSLCTLSPVESKVLTEEMIDDVVRQALFFYATWEPVVGRAVEEKDFVLLDVETIETDPPKPLFRGTRFEVTDASMASWMKSLVLGRQVGESVEGISTPEEDLPPEEKALFPPKKVRLVVRQIEKPILPELTGDLLQKLGVTSQEELRDNLRRTLQGRLDEEKKQKLRLQAEAFLSEKYSSDVPYTSIKKELQFRCSALDKDPEFKRQWNTLSSEQKQNFLKMLEKQCEKSIRLFHLAKHLLDQKKIAVLPEELAEFMRQHSTGGVDQQLLRAEAVSHLLLQKLLDYVVAHATNS